MTSRNHKATFQQQLFFLKVAFRTRMISHVDGLAGRLIAKTWNCVPALLCTFLTFPCPTIWFWVNVLLGCIISLVEQWFTRLVRLSCNFRARTALLDVLLQSTFASWYWLFKRIGAEKTSSLEHCLRWNFWIVLVNLVRSCFYSGYQVAPK